MRAVRLLVCVLLRVAWCDASQQYFARPRSNLCVKNDVPCANDGSCTMVYFPVNSTECGNMAFSSTKSSISRLALGRVRINTYLYEDRSYSQTAFNLTFTNVKWTKMTFRFMQNGNRAKNTCRQFTRSSNSSLTGMFYDCVWSDEAYEGKPFIFDYQAEDGDTIETTRIIFNVPLVPENRAIEETRLLSYVQATPLGLARTQFHLFWPKLPDYMNITYYRVYVFFNDSGTENVLHTSDVYDCQDDLCSFDTHKWFGEISFGVRPVFENNIEGVISRTQYFDLGPDRVSPLLLTLVFCSIFVPIILYIVLILRKRILDRSVRPTPPKILVIHSPTTTPHLHVIEAFVNYLNTYCQVIALVDELDIPRSQSRDPFTWCSEEIATADVVCVVASPFFGKIRSSSALYRTDRLLLRLLREKYGNSGKTRYCAVLPPYTTATDLPIEASSLKLFNMIGDIGKLVRMARYRWPIPQFLVASLDGAFEQNGEELIECIDAATSDLRDNRSRYLQQITVQETETVDSVAKVADPEPLILRSNRAEEIQENKMIAQQLFSDYLGNLEHLNLLGEKKENPVIFSGNRVSVCNFDLDSLKL